MTDKPIAVVLAEDNYECLELHYPRLRLIEAGYQVIVVAPEANKVYKSKEGYWAHSHKTVQEVNPKDVKVLVVPGGFCTDRLRRFPEINQWIADVWQDGNGGVVGAICHAFWSLISAKILKGRKITCFFAVKDDCENAGATVILDQKCVVDGKMVTAQMPDDLPAFMKAILEIAGTH